MALRLQSILRVLALMAFPAMAAHGGFVAAIHDGPAGASGSGFAAASHLPKNETGMDAVFSQSPPFTTANDIDIRFNAETSRTGPTVINNEAQLLALFDSASNDPSPTINFFFVDAINWCSTFNPAIVGCAVQDGNDIVVETGVAAGTMGVELNAHEVGHSLGLEHVNPPPQNLMNGTLNNNTDLTAAQVNEILLSPLVQNDTSGTDPQFFVAITPIAVIAIPEASEALLVLVSGLGLAAARRRPRNR